MEDLRKDLEHIVAGDRILDSELWREIFGRDASYFKILSKAVVRPQTVEDGENLDHPAGTTALLIDYGAASEEENGATRYTP